jgi:hypothetical protein
MVQVHLQKPQLRRQATPGITAAGIKIVIKTKNLKSS